MTFPTINYKFNGIEVAKSLAEVVDQKFAALDKFIGDSRNTVCDVEFEKVATHQHGRVYRVEVTLGVEGEIYRADAVEETFEKAIDVVRNELDRELSRAKDKQTTLDKSAGRELKKQMLKDN